MPKSLLLLIFPCTVSVQVLGRRDQMQSLFSISAAGLRFERGAQSPHYHTLYYVRANAAHVWLEQWGSCHHTPWQRHTPPPPGQGADINPANQHLHREVITEEAETYQNDCNSVMLTTLCPHMSMPTAYFSQHDSDWVPSLSHIRIFLKKDRKGWLCTPARYLNLGSCVVS